MECPGFTLLLTKEGTVSYNGQYFVLVEGSVERKGVRTEYEAGVKTFELMKGHEGGPFRCFRVMTDQYQLYVHVTDGRHTSYFKFNSGCVGQENNRELANSVRTFLRDLEIDDLIGDGPFEW